jgi:hypothetical protein
LKNASEKMQNDKNIILKVVELDGGVLKYASNDLRHRNRFIVCTAMNNNLDSIEFALDTLD